MVLKSFDEIIEKVKERPIKKVVVAGAEDEHALEAVFEAQRAGIVSPVLVGKRKEILDNIRRLGYDNEEFEIIDNPEGKNPGQTAVDVINSGGGDFLLKGRLQTKDYLGPVINKDNNLNPGGVLSAYTFTQIPNYDRMIMLADGSLIIKPTLEQKKGIIVNCVNVLKKLGYEHPKVAVICAVETVNPKMQDTVDAAALAEMWKKGEIKDCDVVGPISLDLAMDKESARIKGYNCPYCGEFDILVAPDLISANFLGKSWIYTAGSNKAGGAVVGAKVPVAMMSRSAAMEIKFNCLVMCAATC